MKLKEAKKCDNCFKLYHNFHIYKGKFLCWSCYCKKIVRIWVGKQNDGEKTNY